MPFSQGIDPLIDDIVKSAVEVQSEWDKYDEVLKLSLSVKYYDLKLSFSVFSLI